MTSFGAMIDILLANPDLALDATYTLPGGSPIACRVIVRKPDADAPLGAAGFGLSPASQAVVLIADVRRSEVAQPARGATLIIGATTYTVERATLDREGLIWRLDLEPA